MDSWVLLRYLIGTFFAAVPNVGRSLKVTDISPVVSALMTSDVVECIRPDVSGFREFHEEFPAGLHVVLVPASRHRQRHHLEIRVGDGMRPANLSCKSRIEKILHLRDLDRAGVGAISPENPAEGARDVVPDTILVGGDQRLGNVLHVGNGVHGDGLDPTLPDHGEPDRLPRCNEVIWRVGPA